jgi:anti-repressor protein
MTDLSIYTYEGNEVRTVQIDGETWWVLKDVCDVLGLTNPTVVASRLDEDEVTKLDLGSLSGEAIIINESGLYNVIIRSDKPEAKPFRRWVTHEVLPAIRKHGIYATSDVITNVC